MSRQSNKTITYKIERLRNPRAKLRTVDLFAGAGGLSLGFASAGFDIIAAVENNQHAKATHEVNFRKLAPHCRMFSDITSIHPEDTVRHYLKNRPDETVGTAVDVIIGGPPCQPFSLSGRAKLRHVAQDPMAFANDDRVTLYTRYLAFVARLRPLAFVMENVLGIGNHKGQNIPEAIAEEVQPLGYIVRYALLNAAWYGVPQMRERMIVIGIHKDVMANADDFFPAATHRLTLPVGYASSRAGRDCAPVRSPHPNWQVLKPDGSRPAVTVEEALRDLPPIRYHLDPTTKVRGTRKFGQLMRYVDVPQTDYSKVMRGWRHFESPVGVADHVMRHTPRDYETFRQMEPGDQYPEAKRIAVRRFEEAVHLAEQAGKRLSEQDLLTLRKSFVPPYSESKYPNKWRKMESFMPARTLPAHLSKDTYSHIHYDDDQARMITVREAARLQSFPDGFVFPVSMIEAFRQIGNAVPPLMALAIARKLKSTLKRRHS